MRITYTRHKHACKHFSFTFFNFFSRGLSPPSACAGFVQVNTAQQERQLLGHDAQRPALFLGGVRPAEPTFGQAFGATPQATAIPVDQLQPGAFAVGKDKEMTAQRVLLETVTDQIAQAFEALS